MATRMAVAGGMTAWTVGSPPCALLVSVGLLAVLLAFVPPVAAALALAPLLAAPRLPRPAPAAPSRLTSRAVPALGCRAPPASR